MDRERWEKVQDLLMDALQRDPKYREAFVRDACKGNDELAEEVISLLNADPSSGLLDQPVLPSGTETDARVGTTIAHYRILSRLGDGGMGVVYKARDTKLQRLVALKFLLPHLARDEEARGRFMREARTASALDHPNICTIYEIGETEDGQTYISMPFYEGQSLAEKIADGSLSLHESLSIAIQAAEGLERAHEAGIIHRDIKPANVFVTDRGRVKILDFGIAKMTGAAVTRTGGTFGTLLYMSPEQLQGLEVDRRSDIWSLGAVLYEMLTGERPFRGEYESAIIYSILHETPRRPSERNAELTVALDSIVARALARDLEDRYEHAIGFKEDLETVLAGQTPDVAPMQKRRSRSTAAVAGFGALALAVLAVVFLLGQRVDIVPVEGGADVSDSLIAVLPFQVSGSEDSKWLGDGIFTSLSMALSGFGVVDGVDPNAISGWLRDYNGVIDPQKGKEVAVHFGAGRFVLGNVTEIGDNVRVSASVYTSDGVLENRFDVANMPKEDLALIVDTLALQIIGNQTGQAMGGLLQAGVRTTRSTDALRAFLRGEEVLRDAANYDQAPEHYKRAVELDSNFAAAWLRLTELSRPSDEIGSNARRRLAALKNRLPRREALAADVRLAADTLDHVGALEQYRRLINQWPQYGRGWYWLGDEIFHGGPFFGSPSGDAIPYFEKALRYDAGNGEMLFHLVDHLARSHQFDRLDSLWAEHPGLRADTLQSAIVLATGRGDEARLKDLRPKLSVQPSRNVQWLGWFLAFSGLTSEARTTWDDLMARPELDAKIKRVTPGLLMLLDLAEGRFDRADETMLSVFEDVPPALGVSVISQFNRLRSPDMENLEKLRSLVAAWDTSEARITNLYSGRDNYGGRYLELQNYVQALLAHLAGDSKAFDRAKAVVDRVAAKKGENSISSGFAATLQAIEQMKNGESDSALRSLARARRIHKDKPGIDPIADQYLNRYLEAEILFDQGEFGEALRWYRTLIEPDYVTIWGTTYLGAIYYRYGQIYDKLGDYEKSAEFYARFIDLWKDADPDVQHYVEDAKTQLEVVLEKQVREPS